MSEKLEKSGFGDLAGGSSSDQDFDYFSQPKPNESVDTTVDSASGGEPLPPASPLLLDPPLTDEEISADISDLINEANNLEELDMMIQSAGPFQHPRSVGQNYGANSYHRQPTYHHHPQVCLIEYILIVQNLNKFGNSVLHHQII